MIQRRIFLTCILLLGVFAPAAHADFTGNYALTPPAFGSFNASTSLGAWTLTIDKHDEAQAEVLTALTEITLNAGSGSEGGTATVTLTYPSVPQAGTITFDYIIEIFHEEGEASAEASVSFTQNGSGMGFDHDSAGTWNWTVAPGDELVVEVTALGGLDFPSTFLESSGSVYIVNFTFTPVPEPGVFALGGGLLALGVVAWRRRRKQ